MTTPQEVKALPCPFCDCKDVEKFHEEVDIGVGTMRGPSSHKCPRCEATWGDYKDWPTRERLGRMEKICESAAQASILLIAVLTPKDKPAPRPDDNALRNSVVGLIYELSKAGFITERLLVELGFEPLTKAEHEAAAWNHRPDGSTTRPRVR